MILRIYEMVGPRLLLYYAKYCAILSIFLAGYISTKSHYIVKPVNTTVREGRTAVLYCTVFPPEIEKMGWTKNGGVVSLGTEDRYLLNSKRYRIVSNQAEGEYHLEISNTTIGDDAEYECQVQPSPGEDGLRWAAFLNVIAPPTKIRLENNAPGPFQRKKDHHRPSTIGGAAEKSIIEAKVGKPIDVTCQASHAKPRPELRWLKLEPGDDLRLIPLPNSAVEYSERPEPGKKVTGLARLRMPVNAQDNGGVFICEARHPANSTHPLRANFTLSVLYPPGQPQIQGFDGRILKSGERLKFLCTVKNGNPKPVLYWYRNGVQIDRSFTLNPDTTVNDYEFTVDPSDNEAEYRCEASNNASLSPVSTSLKLKVVYPPERVRIDGPTEAKVGRTVEFTCESSPSNPPAKITWFFNGVPLDQRPSFQIRGLISISTVRVTLTEEISQTKVQCTAHNDEYETFSGHVNAIHSVNVQYPPQKILIYGYDDKKPILAGNTIALTCVVMGGNPKAEITWYKGEKRVTDGRVEDASVTAESSQRRLTLTVDRTDNGAAYKCQASNAASDSPLVADVNLVVYFPPEKLTIDVSPPLEKLSVGTLADFSCESGPANPAPVINWRRGTGTEILQSVDVYTTSAADGGWIVKNRLRLTLGVDDNGSTFRCTASSPAMNDSTMNEDLTITVHYKPIFTQSNSQSVNVLEKEMVVLNAQAYGNPAVTRYEWSKDGVQIGRLVTNVQQQQQTSADSSSSSKSKFHMHQSNLNISQVDRDDAGSYQCTAYNKEGSSTLTFQVYVNYAAVITYISTPVFADPGGLATLECQVDAYPKTDESMIKWIPPWGRLGGGLGDSSAPSGGGGWENRLRKSYNDGKSYLQLSDARDEDNGEFLCVAYNGIGEATKKSALLLVKKHPVIVNSPAFSKSAADSGQPARLICAAEGVPDVSFMWLRESDGVSMDQAPEADVENTKLSPILYQSVLTIKSVKPEDYGDYTCQARNSIAADYKSIHLNHTTVPDFPLDLVSYNVTSSGFSIKWTPGFDGGLPLQNFRLLYYPDNDPRKAQTVEIVDGAKSLVLENLAPKTEYRVSLESYNRLGGRGFSPKVLLVKTADTPRVALQSMEEEIPVLIILLVSFVGLMLLALNAVLIFCFIRRHQRKKMQEKAAAARSTEPNSRKILMYSGELNGGNMMMNCSAAVPLRPESQYTDSEHRPHSGYSEDENSMRTVIEVDSNGHPLLIERVLPQNHATYLLESSCHMDYADDALSTRNYAESLRSNSLQRQLVNKNVYSTNPGYRDHKKFMYSSNNNNSNPASAVATAFPTPTVVTSSVTSSDDLVPPAMGPLRSISQELNSYGPPSYTHYQNGMLRRYSPTCSTHGTNTATVPTLVQATINGRTPYAEVRPLLTTNTATSSSANHSPQMAAVANGALHHFPSPNPPPIPLQQQQQVAALPGGAPNNNPCCVNNNNNGQQQQGSPVLSTFAAVPRCTTTLNNGSKLDYVDLDCLPGDLV